MPKIMDHYYESKSPTVSYQIRFQPKPEIPVPKWLTETEDPDLNSSSKAVIPAAPSETPVATKTQSATSISDTRTWHRQSKPMIILAVLFVILLLAAGILGYAYHQSKPKINSSSRIGTVELYDPSGGFAGGVRSLYTLTDYQNGNFKIRIPDQHVTFERNGNLLKLQQGNSQNNIIYTGPLTVIYFNNDIILEQWGNPDTHHNQTFHEGEVQLYHAKK